ncbi:MAG: Chemotaxis response regulator protein-glutamate methylesterase [bacterium]|nr:Chemotaxis response regulator protein-glutamate methylesterase [bacterium]
MDHLKRILVVDDEEDLTWSISKSLEKNDKLFEVLCVNNGDSALAHLSTRHVDLVITDVRMPGRDGLALLRVIKRDFPGTRVILMTAHSSDDVRREIALPDWPLFYLEKPFELRNLHQLIYAALDLDATGFDEMLVTTGRHEPEPGSFATDSRAVSIQRRLWPIGALTESPVVDP